MTNVLGGEMASGVSRSAACMERQNNVTDSGFFSLRAMLWA